MSYFRSRSRRFRRRRRGAASKEAVVVPLHVHADTGLTIGIEPYMWFSIESSSDARILGEYTKEPNPQMERIELEARVRIAVR